MHRHLPDDSPRPHRPWRRALLLTGALALCGTTQARRAPPDVVVEALADGTELVVVPLPGSGRASLRWVVRSGGGADPRDRAGLAHVLEHGVFHGSSTLRGRTLDEKVRAAGATLNGFTSPDATWYQLDARREDFEALARDLIGVVTNPALPWVDLEQERGVIRNESLLTSGITVLWVADAFLFPGDYADSLIGDTRSRDRIKHEDLLAFYTQHYVPANTTVVVTGDLTLEQARELVLGASRWPPSLPDEGLRAEPEAIRLPVSERSWAPVIVTIQGYRVDRLPDHVCRDLAELAQLRLTRALIVERTLVSRVDVACTRMRGHQLVLAMAFSQSASASQLPEEIARVYRSLASVPPRPDETRQVLRRHRLQRSRLRADPAAYADTLSLAVVDNRTARGRFDVEDFGTPPTLAASAIVAAARRSFVERNSVLVHLSPFEEQ